MKYYSLEQSVNILKTSDTSIIIALNKLKNSIKNEVKRKDNQLLFTKKALITINSFIQNNNEYIENNLKKSVNTGIKSVNLKSDLRVLMDLLLEEREINKSLRNEINLLLKENYRLLDEISKFKNNKSNVIYINKNAV